MRVDQFVMEHSEKRIEQSRERTEHGEELLRVEILHSPLCFQAVRLGKDVIVEGWLGAKRIDDAQETAVNTRQRALSSLLSVSLSRSTCHLSASTTLS